MDQSDWSECYNHGTIIDISCHKSYADIVSEVTTEVSNMINNYYGKHSSVNTITAYRKILRVVNTTRGIMGFLGLCPRSSIITCLHK